MVDDVDRIGQRAAAALVEEVHRRVDPEDALARLHSTTGDATAFARREATRRARLARVAGVAAVLLIAVFAGVAIAVVRDAPSDTRPAATGGDATPPLSTAVVTSPASAITTAPPSSVAPTTSVEPPATAVDRSGDAMAGFAAAPEVVPSLDRVPLMLPTIEVPGATDVVRSEGGGRAGVASSYVQTYIRTGERAGMLTITTYPGQARAPAPNATVLAITPWDAVTSAPMGPGYASLQLQEPSGTVELWTDELSHDELVGIATDMRPRTGRAGWEVGPAVVGLALVDEGWGAEGASRTITWRSGDSLVAEMWIVSDHPSLVAVPYFPGTAIDSIDLAGTRALAISTDERSAVVWTVAPDVRVMLAMVAPLETVIEIARSVTAVDDATWRSFSTVDASTNDGCDSLFC